MKGSLEGSGKDFVFADTDMLRKRRNGCAGGATETSAATVRGRAPAEVHVPTRHERNAARRVGGHDCWLHARNRNT
ncbi:hypothetical protein GCM10020295_33820 [Streptomyces cinereospinus]